MDAVSTARADCIPARRFLPHCQSSRYPMTRPIAVSPWLGRICSECALLTALSLLSACNGRQDPAAPLPLPLSASQAEPVDADGSRFQAQALEQSGPAASAFGFDIRAAGLLPLRISIDNHGGALKIIPRQTFLIDVDGQAWPLLTSDQAFERLGGVGSQAQDAAHPPSAQALTGFALDVLAGSAFAAEAAAPARPEHSPSQTFARKTQRNPKIAAGQAASGVLFFPGREEAHGVRSLRLCYEQDGRLKYLLLPLKAAPPLAAAHEKTRQ